MSASMMCQEGVHLPQTQTKSFKSQRLLLLIGTLMKLYRKAILPKQYTAIMSFARGCKDTCDALTTEAGEGAGGRGGAQAKVSAVRNIHCRQLETLSFAKFKCNQFRLLPAPTSIASYDCLARTSQRPDTRFKSFPLGRLRWIHCDWSFGRFVRLFHLISTVHFVGSSYALGHQHCEDRQYCVLKCAAESGYLKLWE